jgi:hypothetical protein
MCIQNLYHIAMDDRIKPGYFFEPLDLTSEYIWAHHIVHIQIKSVDPKDTRDLVMRRENESL